MIICSHLSVEAETVSCVAIVNAEIIETRSCGGPTLVELCGVGTEFTAQRSVEGCCSGVETIVEIAQMPTCGQLPCVVFMLHFCFRAMITVSYDS